MYVHSPPASSPVHLLCVVHFLWMFSRVFFLYPWILIVCQSMIFFVFVLYAFAVGQGERPGSPSHVFPILLEAPGSAPCVWSPR